MLDRNLSRHGWLEIVADNIETANKEDIVFSGAAGWGIVHTEENSKRIYSEQVDREIIKLASRISTSFFN